jgi:hypothetical protein
MQGKYSAGILTVWGDRGSTVVKILRYKSDGVMEFFIDVNPSDRTMALGLTQPVTELSTGIISWR